MGKELYRLPTIKLLSIWVRESRARIPMSRSQLARLSGVTAYRIEKLEHLPHPAYSPSYKDVYAVWAILRMALRHRSAQLGDPIQKPIPRASELEGFETEIYPGVSPLDSILYRDPLGKALGIPWRASKKKRREA